MQATIDRSSGFKRQHRAGLFDALRTVLVALETDQPLEARHRDHELSGSWAGNRECHVKPDLLLVYRKLDSDTLRLARLGSYSDLFG